MIAHLLDAEGAPYCYTPGSPVNMVVDGQPRLIKIPIRAGRRFASMNFERLYIEGDHGWFVLREQEQTA